MGLGLKVETGKDNGYSSLRIYKLLSSFTARNGTEKIMK